MTRKIFSALLILASLYLGIGFVFHFKWQSDLAACREMRRAQEEFVEPEVFGGFMGLIFDVTNWPIYAWANIYHYGTPFATPCTHSKVISVSDEEEEAVRYVVESFGKRLQNVSLQSPNAAQVIEEQYAEWADPELLKIWMNDISRAPGRVTSSPWPDRIEITSIVREADKYVVVGFVVEVTSIEVVNGGVAAKIPVRVVLEKREGRWFITEYAEER
jgi:hypothetical protein